VHRWWAKQIPTTKGFLGQSSCRLYGVLGSVSPISSFDDFILDAGSILGMKTVPQYLSDLITNQWIFHLGPSVARAFSYESATRVRTAGGLNNGLNFTDDFGFVVPTRSLGVSTKVHAGDYLETAVAYGFGASLAAAKNNRVLRGFKVARQQTADFFFALIWIMWCDCNVCFFTECSLV
jgi:hypothetical protein